MERWLSSTEHIFVHGFHVVLLSQACVLVFVFPVALAGLLCVCWAVFMQVAFKYNTDLVSSVFTPHRSCAVIECLSQICLRQLGSQEILWSNKGL